MRVVPYQSAVVGLGDCILYVDVVDVLCVGAVVQSQSRINHCVHDN